MTEQINQLESVSQKIDQSHLQIQAKINRLKSQKAILENKLKLNNNVNRKARTRNLIQLGELINMINLPNICGINEANDLQFNLENSDKAAVLLGMLAHLESSLPPTLSNEVINQFKQIGIRVIKKHTAQKMRG